MRLDLILRSGCRRSNKTHHLIYLHLTAHEVSYCPGPNDLVLEMSDGVELTDCNDSEKHASKDVSI